MPAEVPAWTLLPFVALVLAMAVLPQVTPRAWQRHSVQVGIVGLCALPVAAYLVTSARQEQLLHGLGSYGTFIATLFALYVTAGGIHASADFEATPANNAKLLLLGSVLASAIGTMGASVLLIGLVLRTNSQRQHTKHLVPFFILSVANAGGLLTPLGDPPLLVGFVEGVPFFWTLRLLPAWLLYTAIFVGGFYLFDRRAYAREAPEALHRDRQERAPLRIDGLSNGALLALIIVAAFVPSPLREFLLVGIALVAWRTTPRAVHELNQFSFAPIVEVALLFLGLFVCLVPVELALGHAAPNLPLRGAAQLFWSCGLLSAALDNAPTYAAFAALARGLSQGQPGLVAGMSPLHLAAISLGSVVMGATTYIGNGPNLVVKAMAERSGVVMPSFLRYAVFAFLVMLPGHLLVTLALWLLERG